MSKRVVYEINVMVCFVQNNQDILLDLADYDLQEQPEDNSMVAFSQAWYNGAYTLAN